MIEFNYESCLPKNPTSKKCTWHGSGHADEYEYWKKKVHVACLCWFVDEYVLPTLTVDSTTKEGFGKYE